MSKRDVVVLGAARSAIGTFGGALAEIEPVELAGTVMKEAITPVVIPLSTQHYMMLKRNLVYTGITRGKQLVVLVGQKRALAIAVKGQQVERRWSKLQERLHELSHPRNPARWEESRYSVAIEPAKFARTVDAHMGFGNPPRLLRECESIADIFR